MKQLSRVRNLKNKRVLVRVDFNVPIKRKKVIDNTRILSHLDTINYLKDKGAKVILIAHLGRPDGKIKASLKLDPVAEELSKELGKKVKKIDTKNYKNIAAIKKEVNKVRAGQVVLFDNIRFAKDEKNNAGSLGEDLASLFDMFVLDGFGVSHRASASVVGIAQFLPSYAGLLLQKEIKTLTKIMKKPKQPFIAVLGGGKLETKIPVMKALSKAADKLLIGGALINTYYKANGYKVGDSLISKELGKEALTACRKKNVILPLDLVVGTMDGKSFRVVEIKKKPHQICKKGEAILDIGPQTIHLFAKHIKSAQTLIWNGAMGYFEQKPYDVGTMAIARLVAFQSKGKAFGVIGGGETLQTMEMVDMMDSIDFVSTGGGAMLEFLAGSNLPGIDALE